MNRYSLKKSAVAVTIVLTATLGSPPGIAATGAAPTTSAATSAAKEPQTTTRQLLKERQQKIAHEAQDTILETQKALLALQKKDNQQAMKLLQDVSGKLDILLAQHPDMDLLPAAATADIYEFDSTAEQAQKMVDKAGDLLSEHRVQDARYILAELVSEIQITTTSIPLGTFPIAIKDAAALIDQGKTDEASDALYDVLNLLVRTTETFPIPVLEAEALLTEASTMEHQEDLTKEDSRKQVLKLTAAAKEKLKYAETLGYGTKEDYKQLYNTIDEIKNALHSEKSTGAWDKVKKTFSAFKNKIITPKK